MKQKIFGLEIDTERITTQQKIIVAVVIAVLVLGLIGWYVLKPLGNEYVALSQEISQLKTERDSKKAQVRRIDQLRKEAEALNAEIEILSKAIPKKENIPILLIDMEKMGNKVNTVLTSFKPGAPRPYAGLAAVSAKAATTSTKTALEARLKEIPIQLTARTSYRDLIKLFESYEHYERVIKVNNFTLSPIKETGKNSFDGKLDISMDAISYVLEEVAQ